MLVVLRTVFPGVGIVEESGDVAVVVEVLFGAVVVLIVGTVGVDWVFTGRGVGKPEVVTDLVNGFPDGAAIDEAAEPGRDPRSSGISGNGLEDLVFVIGSAGRGAVGGAVGGGLILEGLCGIAEVMVVVMAIDIAVYAQCDVCDCTLPSLPSFAAPARRSRTEGALYCGTLPLHRHVPPPPHNRTSSSRRCRLVPANATYSFENAKSNGSRWSRYQTRVSSGIPE